MRRYPRITLPASLREIAEKVMEEAQEVIDALDSGESVHRVIEEICDTEQATETLALKAEELFGALKMGHGRIFVIDKNSRRGRYPDERIDYDPPQIKEDHRTFVMPKGEG